MRSRLPFCWWWHPGAWLILVRGCYSAAKWPSSDQDHHLRRMDLELVRYRRLRREPWWCCESSSWWRRRCCSHRRFGWCFQLFASRIGSPSICLCGWSFYLRHSHSVALRHQGWLSSFDFLEHFRWLLLGSSAPNCSSLMIVDSVLSPVHLCGLCQLPGCHVWCLCQNQKPLGRARSLQGQSKPTTAEFLADSLAAMRYATLSKRGQPSSIGSKTQGIPHNWGRGWLRKDKSCSGCQIQPRDQRDLRMLHHRAWLSNHKPTDSGCFGSARTIAPEWSRKLHNGKKTEERSSSSAWSSVHTYSICLSERGSQPGPWRRDFVTWSNCMFHMCWFWKDG